jgi:hypothetical protein
MILAQPNIVAIGISRKVLRNKGNTQRKDY